MDSKLKQAITEQLGCDTEEELKEQLENVRTGGANAGFSGFIYHDELLAFYRKNKKLIRQNLKELADDLGESTIKLIAGFNCLQGYDISEDDIGTTLYGSDTESEFSTLIVDSLCWSVLESLAFEYDE